MKKVYSLRVSRRVAVGVGKGVRRCATKSEEAWTGLRNGGGGTLATLTRRLLEQVNLGAQPRDAKPGKVRVDGLPIVVGRRDAGLAVGDLVVDVECGE